MLLDTLWCILVCIAVVCTQHYVSAYTPARCTRMIDRFQLKI